MRLTIIPKDNKVYIDGVALDIDCSLFPSYVHALQWDGTEGELEFIPDANGKRMANVKIVDLAPFQHWIDSHKREIDRMEAEAKKAAEAPQQPKAEGGMNVIAE